LAHAVGIAVGDYDIRVMEQPVQQADGGGVLGQEPAPRFKGPVAMMAWTRRKASSLMKHQLIYPAARERMFA
jgi:hypothetical protein